MEATPKSSRRRASLAEPDPTANFFISEYFSAIEEFPNELSRLVSTYRELDANVNNKIESLEHISKLINSCDEKEILLSKVEEIAEEMQRLNEEKMDIASEINNLITEKGVKMRRDKPKRDSQKRGKMKAEIKNAVATELDSPSNDLLILASVAVEKQEKIEKEQKPPAKEVFTKIPVTKRAEKGKKRRKNKPNSKKDETAADEEEAGSETAPAETDENEPLYCLCNRVSFGQMVECSNEACPLEWCHFTCVGVKKPPKGKWYCPKCRSRRPNVLKKELNC